MFVQQVHELVELYNQDKLFFMETKLTRPELILFLKNLTFHFIEIPPAGFAGDLWLLWKKTHLIFALIVYLIMIDLSTILLRMILKE